AEDTRHELAVARIALAESLGEATPRFAAVDGSLARGAPPDPWEAIEARLERSPEIVERASARALREAELALARAKAVPNLGLFVGGRRREGPDEQSLVFGVELPFAVFDRNQGGILESVAAIDRAGAELAQARAELRATAFALHQELVH